MKKQFVEVDGVKYQVFICPGCGAELRFKMTKDKRRMHCMCKKCMRELEVEVDNV